MLRFRRYRVFLICAILLTILLVRLSRRNEWDGPSFPDVKGVPSTWEGYKETYREDHKDDSEGSSTPKQEAQKDGAPKKPVLNVEKPAQTSIAESKSIPQDEVPAPPVTSSSIRPLSTPDTVKTIPD